MRMAKYQSLYNSILNRLKTISKLQLEAFNYWITKGNLSHINPNTEIYPNVSLTCLNPMLKMGLSFYEKDEENIKDNYNKGI